MTIAQLQTAIDTNLTPSSGADRITAAELRSTMENFKDELLSRGITNVADTTALAALSGANFKAAVVESNGVFKWLGSGTPNGTTIFAASGGGTWNRILSVGGASAINDLTDVTITSAAEGDSLEYNGSAFVNVNKSYTELTGTTWDGSNKYKTLTANLSLTLSGTKTAGLLYIAGNSSYTLTINGTAITINNTGDSIVGFIKQNGTYVISTDLSPVAIGGADVTAPTVVSATAIDANTIRIVFSEAMGAVTVAGHSFKQNGTPITPDSVSGATTTWDFVVSETLLSTDTILRSYDSTTGATTDVAGNELASYTDAAVTNSIANEVEYIDWDQLSNMTDAGSGTLDNANSNAGGGTATKKLTKANGNFVQYTIPTTVAEATAFVLSLDNNNDGIYGWTGSGSGLNILAGVYLFTTLIVGNGPVESFSSTDTGISPSADDIIRLEISGDDVIAKRSTNGGASFSTLHTLTGALSGITDIYVKGILAAGSASQRILQNTEGKGLVTI